VALYPRSQALNSTCCFLNCYSRVLMHGCGQDAGVKTARSDWITAALCLRFVLKRSRRRDACDPGKRWLVPLRSIANVSPTRSLSLPVLTIRAKALMQPGWLHSQVLAPSFVEDEWKSFLQKNAPALIKRTGAKACYSG
jgi:hypothetical protein